MNKLPVDYDISVSPDGGSEVSIEGHVEGKMVGRFLRTMRCKVMCKLHKEKSGTSNRTIQVD